MAATKEDFFKRAKVSAEEKAAQTNAIARDIVAAEAAQRAKKTERLRQLREAQDADTVASPARGRKPSASSKR